LEALAGGNPDSPLAVNFTLRAFVARRLSIEDPPYLALGDQILVKELEMADVWARDDITWAKLEPAYPPMEWLGKRISVDDIDLGNTSPPLGLRDRGNWSRLLARFTEGDELWEFDSPREHWERLTGRKGVDLSRTLLL
jgi:hypothetical protein